MRYHWCLTFDYKYLCLYSYIFAPCDMTHSCVSRDSFIHVSCLIHMCNMTHSYVCRDSLICVPCLIHMCDVTHSYACHASFTCAKREQDRKRIEYSIGPIPIQQSILFLSGSLFARMNEAYRTYRAIHSLSVLLSVCTQKWGMAHICKTEKEWMLDMGGFD